MKPFAFLPLLIGVSLLLPTHGFQCGTAQLLQRLEMKQQVFGKGSGSENLWGSDIYGRALVTEHFVLRYALNGIHQAKWTEADSVLRRMRDSLNALHPDTLDEYRRDSLVYTELDRLNAPHPAFVQANAMHFEGAWQAYVVGMGMLAPDSRGKHSFNSAQKPQDRFPIEILDINTVEPSYSKETYALTFPPSNLVILMENDFLYNAYIDEDGVVQGDSLKSRSNGVVYNNYAVSWAEGIKVTAYHEFYHAIQFTYTPWVRGYHAWYELSATGMEERHAPEVDDYLQYLPRIFQIHASKGILAARATEGEIGNYGNGIFHLHLGNKLGYTFDRHIWDRLQQNDNDIEDAIGRMLLVEGAGMDTLMLEYASQFLFTQGRFPNPYPPLTPDMDRWPMLQVDTLSLQAKEVEQFRIPPLAFDILEVVSSNSQALREIITDRSELAAQLLVYESGSMRVEALSKNRFRVGSPGTGRKLFLVLANTSLNSMATAESHAVSSLDSHDLRVYPNPLSLSKNQAIRFWRSTQADTTETVEWYDEFGHSVQTVTLPEGQELTVWGLQDFRGRRLVPGVYYYSRGGRPLRPIIVHD